MGATATAVFPVPLHSWGQEEECGCLPHARTPATPHPHPKLLGKELQNAAWRRVNSKSGTPSHAQTLSCPGNWAPTWILGKEAWGTGSHSKTTSTDLNKDLLCPKPVTPVSPSMRCSYKPVSGYVCMTAFAFLRGYSCPLPLLFCPLKATPSPRPLTTYPLPTQ